MLINYLSIYLHYKFFKSYNRALAAQIHKKRKGETKGLLQELYSFGKYIEVMKNKITKSIAHN